MGSQLVNKNDKVRLGKIFQTLDTNNNGKLDKQELKKGYEDIAGKVLSEQDLN